MGSVDVGDKCVMCGYPYCEGCKKPLASRLEHAAGVFVCRTYGCEYEGVSVKVELKDVGDCCDKGGVDVLSND